MILGVMPLEIRLWKPLTAPQAMVMKQKGNSLPGTTSPPPFTNSEMAGIFNTGSTTTVPTSRVSVSSGCTDAMATSRAATILPVAPQGSVGPEDRNGAQRVGSTRTAQGAVRGAGAFRT